MKFTPWENPMGTDGFEFIEYAAPDPAAMGEVFERMGFKADRAAPPQERDAVPPGRDQLHRQRRARFLRAALRAPARAQRLRHRLPRAGRARPPTSARSRLGAWGFADQAGPGELNIPAIKGIGDSLIYLVDRWRGKNGAQAGRHRQHRLLRRRFRAAAGRRRSNPTGHGLTYIDHLTHNVHRGRMKEWADFYERLFNFREVRYFDIEGQVTGVKSKAMTSPCGKIRIPINEEGNEKAGQIQEYLDSYHGEGIQHIALGSRDLYKTVDALRASGVKLLDTSTPTTSWSTSAFPGHGENVAELQEAQDPDRRQARASCCCRSSARTSSGRSSSSSSSARATKASARATSRRCSSRSSSTRCAAAC